MQTVCSEEEKGIKEGREVIAVNQGTEKNFFKGKMRTGFNDNTLL